MSSRRERVKRESWIGKGARGSNSKGEVSRGLFARDSFDRVFVDGENSKRFREKRVSFSRLSYDIPSATREIKRTEKITRVHSASYTASSLPAHPVCPFCFFVPALCPLPFTPISCMLSSLPVRDAC